MENIQKKLHRKSIRIPGYNYTLVGGYFITLCTGDKKCILGDVQDNSVNLSGVGEIVRKEWLRTQELRPGVAMDEFVIMPNHIHGIIRVGVGRGTACRAPTTEKFGKPIAGSIPTIIRAYKAAVSKKIHEVYKISHAIWQRNYYERVVRNEKELKALREYIRNNPIKWELDPENPHKKSKSE